MTDLSERDYEAAATYAKWVVSEGLARYAHHVITLARCYLALQSRLEAGIVGMVPSGWALYSLCSTRDGFMVELVSRTNESHCVRGTGPTPEAAVKDAAGKVKP